MRYRIKRTQVPSATKLPEGWSAGFDRFLASTGRPRLRVRRQPLELVAEPPIAGTGCSRPRPRTRRRQPLELVAQSPLVAILPTQPPPKRRGRAPAHIPDPWADLEWDVHEDAKRAVAEHPAGMTLEEIGAKMNITRERVRQIENSALRKLREDSGSDIAWSGRLTLAIPDCRRCGDPFVRRRGRQDLCEICESKRRRKRPYPATVASSPMCA